MTKDESVAGEVKIAQMALSLLMRDPNKDELIEFRKAAFMAAANMLDLELGRQTLMAMLSQTMKR